MKTKFRKGQTMVEYIIIVSIIAVALIAVFSLFGKAIGRRMASATSAISTEEGNKANAAVDRMSDSALPEISK